jgi:hypothetical protein
LHLMASLFNNILYTPDGKSNHLQLRMAEKLDRSPNIGLR